MPSPFLIKLIKKIILEEDKKKYYVGKIIMDTANVNPATYLGFGEWVLWGAGKVPVGVDINDSDFDTVEKIGGEKTHKMTENEMYKHSHTRGDMNIKGNFYFRPINTSGHDLILGTHDVFNKTTTIWEGSHDGIACTAVNNYPLEYINFDASKNWTGSTSSVGNNEPFNIVQSYITCYMWKRIA